MPIPDFEFIFNPLMQFLATKEIGGGKGDWTFTITVDKPDAQGPAPESYSGCNKENSRLPEIAFEIPAHLPCSTGRSCLLLIQSQILQCASRLKSKCVHFFPFFLSHL
jgi:hypothetical protein